MINYYNPNPITSPVDRKNLYRHCRSGSHPPRAHILLVHGIGEHGGRYGDLARRLVEKGYQIHAYDQRGHGLTEGRRGHILKFSDYINDLAIMVSTVNAEANHPPWFLYGHSMGALVVVKYMLDNYYLHDTATKIPLPGLILSAIPWFPVGAAGPFKKWLALRLTKFIPDLQLKLGFGSAALTSKPEAVEKFRKDKLNHPWATIRWGTEMLTAIEQLKQSAHKIATPCLLFHGEADRIALASGTEVLAKQITQAQVLVHIFPKAQHEPHNDGYEDDLCQRMDQWIQEQIKLNSPS